MISATVPLGHRILACRFDLAATPRHQNFFAHCTPLRNLEAQVKMTFVTERYRLKIKESVPLHDGISDALLHMRTLHLAKEITNSILLAWSLAVSEVEIST